MRIAAGIVLIIAAVINIFAALGYLGGGALSSAGGASALSKALQEESAKSGQQLTAEQTAAMAKLQQASEKASSSGGMLMGFGAFLALTVITSIAGAVCLFRGKAAKFIVIAALLAGGAEVGGILITRFGYANVAGLLGAVLALVAARSIMAKAASGVPARA